MLDQLKSQVSALVSTSLAQRGEFLRKEFYRKIQLKSWLRRVGEDAVARPKKYVGLAIVGFLLFGALFGDYGLATRIRLEIQRARLQAELEAEHRRAETLAAQIANAKSLETIEKLAREKYGFRKPGETV
ncbi:MAG: septum formation initiator family protein, partial [Chloroherpetonaceae bacterium]|nr:septum formation initiator family protein [Chloroherpetonaceae bacterium]MDW8438384.1 septum formation initiator family protein [Chloroherpetonaceae bacterium]